ncbi:MAG: protein-arginine deiminase family protein [Acidobacteriota bacterium]
MAPARPMLDGVELPLAQRIASEDGAVLAQHDVPALEGDFLQDLGRRATRFTLTGVLAGAGAEEGLAKLRDRFHAAEPVPFVSDIGTATKVDKVLIEEMGVRELAGRPARFEYSLTLREYAPPPAVEEEAPPALPPPPPVPTTATLVVEVIVEGEPAFDFSRVTVTTSGTGADGAPVTRTLTNRNGNVWTEAGFPPGQHTVQAMAEAPDSRTGSAPAQVREGETTQVTVTLQAATVVARRFLIHFWFDKGFVEPCMREALQRVGDYSNAHPDEKLLIVGHTDLVGDAGVPSSGIRYNQSLSERRARAVFGFMTFGRDRAAALADWNELRRTQTGGPPTLKDSWGTRQYQYMLQDLGFYAGQVDEVHGDATTASIRDFQRDKGLTVNGTMDGPTWSALIEAYLDRDAPAIPESRFLPNSSAGCDGGILKWLGCEEQDPVRNTEDAWRPNRRVELLFVRAERLPCQQPQPDTFNLPTPGAVSPSWCLGPGNRSQRICFVTPSLQPCAGGPAWCRQPAEPGTVTVRGRIARADGTPLANARYFLIAPDGLYLHTDSSGAADLGEVRSGPQRGRPILGRTDADGRFSHPDPTPVGTYILEVQEPVVVRLADDPGLEAKGNVVCKRMDGTSDFNVLVCGGVATTFELEVTNATRVGGAGSNVFVATRADPGDVLITAVTPAGTCAAPRSITWTGGLPVRGHGLQRRVPRATAGQTTVTATMSSTSVTRSVDIFIVRLTLDVDADRDGTVEVDGTGKDVWQFGAGRKGAVLLCNCDNDDKAAGNLEMDNENVVVDGAADVPDLAPLVVRQSGPLPAGLSLVLSVSDKDKIRVFAQRASTAAALIGPEAALPAEVAVTGAAAADVELGMEGTRFPSVTFDGLVRLTLALREGSTEIATDVAEVRVAPWVMPSHLQTTEELFVVEILGLPGFPANASFIAGLQSAATAAGVTLRQIRGAPFNEDPWAQDFMEIGYTRVPGRQMPVVLNAPNPRELDSFAPGELLGPDFGLRRTLANAAFNTLDSHGNLEVSPPVTLPTGAEFKLGRIYHGRGRSGNPFNARVREFLRAQLVQKPFVVDTDWLAVGHVDEIISFVPSTAGKPFRMLFASTTEALRILRALRDAGRGGLKLFTGKSRTPFQERTVTQILGNAPLLAQNATCQARLDGVESVMAAELGLDPAADIVRIPSLFIEEELAPGFFSALMPGMVNLLAITRPDFARTQLVLPRPFGPVLAGVDQMEQDVRTKLAALGFAASQVRFVDDFDTYHVNLGEVHCGTNSRRLAHATPWWEQTDF